MPGKGRSGIQNAESALRAERHYAETEAGRMSSDLDSDHSSQATSVFQDGGGVSLFADQSQTPGPQLLPRPSLKHKAGELLVY